MLLSISDLFVISIPGRFGIRPTLGQLCPRKVPPPNYSESLQRNQRDTAGQNG